MFQEVFAMTVHPTGPGSVAIHLTSADLAGRCAEAEELTEEAALSFARDAFARAGISPEGPIRLEIYPGRGGALVFAQGEPGRLWVSFGDFECLLSALRALPAPPSAGLVWWEGCYWLSLPAGETGVQAILSEYGDVRRPDAMTRARLAEYGRPIAGADPAAKLLRCFPV